jgi:octaprenyl-diphosphate synthase
VYRIDLTRAGLSVDGIITPDRNPLADENPACADALTRLSLVLKDDLAATNQTILTNMASDVPLVPQLAAHIVAAGGKRLRPLLTLAAARLCGYQGARHIGLAACVEFIHTATLLHDDVVDDSHLRRGLASANAVFGNKAPVLVGDFLFARAFELMVADGSLDVLRILCRASATIAEGEVLQLATQNDLSTDIPRYFKVIEGKTAALFAAACEVGGVIAGVSAEQCAGLSRYGNALGMAFQLVDDALDYAADQGQLGKAVGDDFREGKLTYPILLAYQAGDARERAFWQRTIEQSDQGEADLAEAMALMARHDAIGGTIARAELFAAEARSALALLPADPLRDLLAAAADYAVARNH